MKETFSEKEFENIVKRYESILENIPETIYSSLPDEIGSTIFLSKKLEDWTGFDSETFLKDPNHWIKTIHPLDRNKVLKQYNEAKNKKSEFLLEYRLINKNSGDIIYIKDHGVPVFNNNGKLMRYDGVMTNITDIVLKDKKLKESEEKYHHLFENSPYVVGLFNFEGILLDVNEKANDFVSLHNVKDLIGLHFTEIWEFNKKTIF
ncbi:MAG: PAS domain-containing protein [Candidatus Lokiarchaeota archaeon]